MKPSEQFPIVVVACKIFQGLVEMHLPEEVASQITFLDYGLHRIPKKLKAAIQESIDSLPKPSLVVLGYGLCGNGLDGIQSRDNFLLVARADDCIAVLLGSYEAYRQQFDDNPGTYYLTRGWLESGSNPLQEYREYVEKYGEASADWIMDEQYRNYKRLVLVAHTQEELERIRPQALEVATYCERWGMRYEELSGNEDYIKRLAEIALTLEKANQEFILIPPGGVLRQADFIRG